MTPRISLPVIPVALLLGICLGNPVVAQVQHDNVHAGPAMNFHRINPRLATGGHFNDDGIASLSQQGVTVVIDLRDQPPEGQQQRLADAGIRWINVPVVWKSPQREDFQEFSRWMSEYADENIFVQCQANYRASAMTYAYRVSQAGVPDSEARKDLEAIWTLEGTWKAYIDEILDETGKAPD